MSNLYIEARLTRAIREDKAPHAILITGPQGSAAGQIARRAAAVYLYAEADEALLDACPDIFVLGPEPIPVDSIRQLQLSLMESAFTGRRAAVLLDAHRMNDSAQNALLKTLEEPPENTLLLLAGMEEGLLHTIRSRCSILRLGSEPEDQIYTGLIERSIEPDIARLAAFLADGAPELANAYATRKHADYFDKAAALLLQALTEPITPYTALSKQLDLALVKDKDAKSKAAKQRPGAEFMLRAWQLILADMLRCKHGAKAHSVLRSAPKLLDTANGFTTRQIQGIIEKVLSARMRLGVANPSMTMDALITNIKG